MAVLTRKEALNQGEKKYYTGRPCKNGHYSLRYSVSGSCEQCVRLADKLNKENAKSMLLRQSQHKSMVE